MPLKLLLLARDGITRERLCKSLSQYAEVHAFSRESAITEARIAITDDQLWWQNKAIGQEIAIDVAIVLDSGYMLPLPMLDPTEEQWLDYRENFDDYLRYERESASLWYSFLELLNHRVTCINEQSAFAFSALKPYALHCLHDAQIPVAPHLLSNDPDLLCDFAQSHNQALLELPIYTTEATTHWMDCKSQDSTAPSSHLQRDLSTSAMARWCSADEVRQLDLSQQPLWLHGLLNRQLVKVIAIDDRAVWWEYLPHKAQPHILDDHICQQIPHIHRCLSLQWSALTFGQCEQGWCLVDFSPAPSLDILSEQDAQTVAEALWQYILKTNSQHTKAL
jgi:hypothetical protein